MPVTHTQTQRGDPPVTRTHRSVTRTHTCRRISSGVAAGDHFSPWPSSQVAVSCSDLVHVTHRPAPRPAVSPLDAPSLCPVLRFSGGHTQTPGRAAGVWQSRSAVCRRGRGGHRRKQPSCVCISVVHTCLEIGENPRQALGEAVLTSLPSWGSWELRDREARPQCSQPAWQRERENVWPEASGPSSRHLPTRAHLRRTLSQDSLLPVLLLSSLKFLLLWAEPYWAAQMAQISGVK